MSDLEQRLARAMFADTNDCSEDRFELAEQITQETYLSNAQAALKAHAECLAEQGLVVVPREPTIAMITADTIAGWDAQAAEENWQAMISAAQEEQS